MAIKDWSTTPSANATADASNGINWAEHMPPSQINDSARAMMAVIKGDFANNIAANGYQKLPNGMIFQWGFLTSPDGSNRTLTFPIAFPTACLSLTTGTIYNGAATRLVSVTIGSAPTTTGTSLQYRYVDNGGSVGLIATTAYWQAVGN